MSVERGGRFALPAPPHLPRTFGRDRCGGTGYRGRVSVYDLLTDEGPIRELILRGAPARCAARGAASSRFLSLAADAWSKVEAGLTTVEEVRPLLGLLAEESRACRSCGGAVWRGAVYCPGCGGSLAERCEGCGAEAQPHWRFCAGCGGGLASLRRRPTPVAAAG